MPFIALIIIIFSGYILIEHNNVYQKRAENAAFLIGCQLKNKNAIEDCKAALVDWREGDVD